MNNTLLKKVEPIFNIDENGIVVCKSHSNYDYLSKNKVKYFDLGFKDLFNKKKPLHPIFTGLVKEFYAWCDTCDHNREKSCYFSVEEINEFKKLRGPALGLVFNKVKCEMCSGQVFNKYNTMRVRYLEKKRELRIPLLCSKCNYDIRHDKVKGKVAFYILMNVLLLLIATGGTIIPLIITFLTSSDIALISFMLFFTGIMSIFIFFLIKRTWKISRYKKILRLYPKKELLE